MLAESCLPATWTEHLDAMRETAREMSSLQSESESLLATCDMYRQQCDQLRRNIDRHGILLEYYDRYHSQIQGVLVFLEGTVVFVCGFILLFFLDWCKATIDVDLW